MAPCDPLSDNCYIERVASESCHSATMSCLSSAAFRDDEILDSIERSYNEKIPVKVEDSKEDLQKRLAELRTHIGDAKVDW